MRFGVVASAKDLKRSVRAVCQQRIAQNDLKSKDGVDLIVRAGSAWAKGAGCDRGGVNKLNINPDSGRGN
jgi:hypothetical protein